MIEVESHYPEGLSAADVEVVDNIVFAVCSQNRRARQLYVTQSTMADFVQEYGKASVELKGFTFPGYRWFITADHRRAELVVIDQGVLRVHFLAVSI
ncbi:hypothetical protein [Lysobacter terrae]